MGFQAFPWWRWHRRISVKIIVMANICFPSWLTKLSNIADIIIPVCFVTRFPVLMYRESPQGCYGWPWPSLVFRERRLCLVADYAGMLAMLATYVSYLVSGLTSLTALMNDWVWVEGVARHQARLQTPILDFISGKLIPMTLSRVGITQSI